MRVSMVQSSECMRVQKKETVIAQVRLSVGYEVIEL